jgi:hypothetical protein
MIHSYKGKAKYISAWGALVLLVVLTSFGGNKFVYNYSFHNSLTADTVPEPKKRNKILTKQAADKVVEKTIQQKEITRAKEKTDTADVPTADTFSIKYAKGALDAPITYHADDSMVLDVPDKKIRLYGKENKTTYQDNELVAPVIEYDQKTNVVSAYMMKDSLGNVISYATFIGQRQPSL